MKAELMPSGRYRIRIMIKGKRYCQFFDTEEEALAWAKNVKNNKRHISVTGETEGKKYDKLYGNVIDLMDGKSKKKEDYIKDELIRVDGMSGIQFEKYCISLLELSGFFKLASFQMTKKSGDYGADIVVETMYGQRISVQCKRLKNSPIRIDAVQEVVGSKSFYKTKKCIIISNSHISSNALNLAIANRVVIIDRDKLIKLIEYKYKNLESIYNKKQWDIFEKIFM